MGFSTEKTSKNSHNADLFSSAYRRYVLMVIRFTTIMRNLSLTNLDLRLTQKLRTILISDNSFEKLTDGIPCWHYAIV